MKKVTQRRERPSTIGGLAKAEPMPVGTIRSMLAARYRYSVGRTEEVATLVHSQPKRGQSITIRRVIECLYDEDPGVVLRASGVIERVTRLQPALLNRWKAPLLALLRDATENKLRWNLALIVPRLTLTVAECRHVAVVLQAFLDDASSVIKTFALQGLADLTLQDPSFLPEVLDLLDLHSRNGTPAMRARSRLLIEKLTKPSKSARR